MGSVPRSAFGGVHMLLVLSIVVVIAAPNPGLMTNVTHEDLILPPDTTDREDIQLCLLQTDSSMRHPRRTLARVSQVGPHGEHMIPKSMAVRENASNIVVVKKKGERKYDSPALTVTIAALQTDMTAGSHGNAVLQPDLISNTIDIPAMASNMTYRTGDMPPLQLSNFSDMQDVLANDMGVNAKRVYLPTTKRMHLPKRPSKVLPSMAQLQWTKNISFVSLSTETQTSGVNLWNIIWAIAVIILLGVIIYLVYHHFHREPYVPYYVPDKHYETIRGTMSGWDQGSRLKDVDSGKACC